ncbi:MAG TPA: CDP-alcohol phosphatidyltransferase family protein [Candidatus Acidoferrales bacterium]|nr:CDP-alcohol phosphatidyltransferase family protein [Candidatus Acidoferrales bacterium]
MKRHVPFLLTALRLLLGPLALACAFTGAPRIIYLPILLVGTLSDIFDGILARRFGVSTQALRRFDSVTDAIYYAFVLAALWILCKPAISKTLWAIAFLILSELATITVSLARFRKYPATHTYLAKFYGLSLLGGLTALLAFSAPGWVVIALMTVALVTNAEIVLIHLASDAPPVDVPSIFALRERAD